MTAGFVSIAKNHMQWPDFLPNSGALSYSAIAMHEFVGMFSYWLGNLGA